MKIKLSRLQQSAESLKAIAQTKLNLKLSYDIAKRLRYINNELEMFQQTRIAKAKELSEGKLKENGTEFDIPKADLVKLNEELSVLLDTEIELDITPIKLVDLGDISIEPAHLVALDYLIIE